MMLLASLIVFIARCRFFPSEQNKNVAIIQINYCGIKIFRKLGEKRNVGTTFIFTKKLFKAFTADIKSITIANMYLACLLINLIMKFCMPQNFGKSFFVSQK